MTEHSSSPHSTSSPLSESAEQQTPTRTKGIGSDEIRAILAECESAGLPETIDDDTLLVLDSFTTVWIQHLLEERHGIVVKLSGETAGVDSVSALRDLVNRTLDDVGAA